MQHRSLQAAVLAAAFFAFVPALAADIAAGQRKAEPCAQCHGPTGNSTMEEVPSLAAQPAYYLVMQLFLFRDKQRDIPAMTPFAEGLGDRDLEDLAAFFAAQMLDPVESNRDAARFEAGRRIAEANHCGACHLPDYSGRDQMARLAGQREDYLLKAMRDFKAGQRAGFDGTMTEALYHLTDGDLVALAHFLAQLR